jgi:hypothetical protein
MAYPPKIDEALKVLDAAGVSRRRSTPLSYRVLWSFGIPVRPPQFHGVLVGVVLPVALYAATFGIVKFLLEKPASIDGHFALPYAASVLAFSVIYVPWMLMKRRCDLPDWSEIGVADRFD